MSRGPGYALGISGIGASLIRNAVLLPGIHHVSDISLTWNGANPTAALAGEEIQKGESNFLGSADRGAWRQHVAHFGIVKIANLYPGVDMKFHGNQERLEFDYIVAPGADASAIRIGIGAAGKLDERGQLEISEGGEALVLEAPVAYQEGAGGRKPVHVEYALSESHEVSLAVGEYDKSRELVIDPVLSFAAHFGATSNMTNVTDVAVDSTGDIYLTGFTCDVDYPVTSAALQPSGGSISASPCTAGIITKLDAAASQLIYSTYLGSRGNVTAGARILAVAGGGALVAGLTTATDFPTTTGVYQTAARGGTCSYGPFLVNQGCTDTFLLQLSADGSSLVFSTYFGGSAADIIMAMTVDGGGNIYVAGSTNSPDFPVTSGTFQTAYHGGSCRAGLYSCYDAFVAKFDSTGSHLLESTLLGGGDNDAATGVGLDSLGNIYVGGATYSMDFPTTLGAFQTAHSVGAGQADVFVSKLSPDMKSLRYSTLIGGTGADLGLALQVDSMGAAYITGSTVSTDFPTTAGSYQTAYKGPASPSCSSPIDTSLLSQPSCGDIFVTKLDTTGAVVYSTYIGGSGQDIALNAGLDSGKNLWLIANTDSTDFPFTSDAYYTSNGSNVALLELSADGKTLPFATPLVQGTAGQSLALGLKMDAQDDVYVAGQATIFSPTPGTFTSGTGPAVFLAKFAPGSTRPGVQLSATSITFPSLTTPVGASTAPQSVTLTNNGTAPLHLSISLQPPFAGTAVSFTEYDNCGNTVAIGASCTINAVYQPADPSGNSGSGFIRILDDAPGAPHSITLLGASGTIDSASFVPATLTFNGQGPGTTSAAQNASLTTPGTLSTALLPVTTGLPVVSGTNASEFAVNPGNPGNCPIATHFCGLSVTFTPASSATGTRTATVSVATEAANSPQTLNLVGNVSAGPFAVIPFPPGITPISVGTTENVSVSLKNIGGSTLTVTGVTPGGANPGDFVLSNTTCSGYPVFMLASQASCALNLAFKPGAHGTRSATMTLVDNESSPAAFTFTGYGQDATGPALVLSVSPSPVNGQVLFADTVVNTSPFFGTAAVTLINNGNASAQVTSTTLTGDFTQTNTCQSVITASASCSYTVTFAPKQVGIRTGTLTIVTNAPVNQTFTVNFSGNGVQIPVARLTPSNLNFGTQEVGTTSAAQTATLTNAGTATLNLSNVSVTGPFTSTPTTCGATLSAGMSCTYAIKFAPVTAGYTGGTLTAITNAAGGSAAIGFNGTGVTGPVAKATPASLTFGAQPINTTSPSQSVAFSNVGDTAFTIAGIRASENFSETNTCPASLTPGTGCTINVSFVPTNDVFVGGTAQTDGKIFVTTNAPGSPFSILLVGQPIASTGRATSAAVTSSLNPSTFGQSVTFTATVTPTGTGTPTGTVTFLDGTTQLGPPANLNSQAKATFTTSSLAVGNHTITVQYNGDTTFAPSSSSGLLQMVSASAKASTTTVTVSSLNPSTVGQNITFTATVTSGTAGTITGTVTFFDGATQIGSPATLSGGSGHVSSSALTQGSHSITAQYSGDPNFASSTSVPIMQIVNAATKLNTTNALGSSQNPSTVGQSVTFTATVTPASGSTVPTGSVSFTDGANALGLPMNLDVTGKATLVTSLLSAGSHSIAASYAGDSTFNGSFSNTVTQVVNAATTKTNTSTTLGASPNPSTAGQSVTFTATVAPASGTAVPTGSVSFTDGASSLGSPVTLDGAGKATLATSALTVATHNITASYAGDSSFNPSGTSSPVAQVVNAATAGDFTISVQQSSLTVTAGQSGTLNVTVTPTGGFNQQVLISCSGLPPQSSCSGPPVTPNGAAASTTVTILTKSNALAPGSPRRPATPIGQMFSPVGIAALAALALLMSFSRRKRIRLVLACGMAFVAVALLSCNSSGSGGGGNSTGTPPGTYSVTITGAAGADIHNAPNTVTLKVN